jgi:bifunctional oligoribonuclease and PAP phosphatase NrnA
MTYATPPSRLPAVRQVLTALEEASVVVLTTHLNADGDGTGSQAALFSFLRERGKEVWIVNPTPFPDLYRFLIPDPSRILPAGSEEALRRCQAAHLCVVVDTGEVSRIGRLNPMVEGVPKVVIDHHPPGDRAIEGLSLRDPGASAAGELVFDLILEAGGEWTPTVVDGIYTAILTDTGSFRFSNATPAAHRIAAELIQRGASPEHLYQRIYGSFPLRRFELLRRALETLSLSHEGRVSYMTIPRDAYRELGCRPDDLEGLVDIPREVEGSEIAILFREMEDGAVKISFRSSGSADVNAVARSFGGGGHVKASGALVTGPLDEVIERVVARAGEGLPPAEGEPEGEEART